jgi:PAS domain S-box-containing protein
MGTEGRTRCELSDEVVKPENDLSELRLTVQKSAQIIDRIPASVKSTDLDGRVTLWNKGSENLSGYTMQEAVGKHVSFLYPSDEHSVLRDDAMAVLKEHAHSGLETTLRRKSGTEFVAHPTLSLHRDEAQNPTDVTWYVTESSDGMRAREEQGKREDGK